MRATAVALAVVCGLTMLSAAVHASPTLAHRSAADPAVTLAAGGCGPAFHPRTFRDPYGRLVTECVPNRPARRCAPGWHLRSWVDPYGRVHGRCAL